MSYVTLCFRLLIQLIKLILYRYRFRTCLRLLCLGANTNVMIFRDPSRRNTGIIVKFIATLMHTSVSSRYTP